VSDHCRGIEAVLHAGVPGEVYNIGGRCESTNRRLLDTLCAIADRKFAAHADLRSRFPLCPASRGAAAATLITYVKDRPGHDQRYAIDCGKLETQLGFSPTMALEAGLANTFEWYLQNEVWWRDILDGRTRRSA
jgi:dTDP-glucose 4,6-dehydratase